MKNSILPIILATSLAISSCGNSHEGEQKPTLLSNAISITDNEDKGVKDILDFYGGSCKYSIGASASTETGSKKYFQLELSQSDGIDSSEELPALPSSNIAYLFYMNLNNDERSNYKEIRTVLNFSDGKVLTSEFETKQLELVDEKMKVVEKVVQLIKEKDFAAISSIINDSVLFIYDKNELIEGIETAESQLGNVTKGFRPFGFEIRHAKDGTDVLHISGAIIRDKQSNQFSVDMDLNGTGDNIYMLQYEL